MEFRIAWCNTEFWRPASPWDAPPEGVWKPIPTGCCCCCCCTMEGKEGVLFTFFRPPMEGLRIAAAPWLERMGPRTPGAKPGAPTWVGLALLGTGLYTEEGGEDPSWAEGWEAAAKPTPPPAPPAATTASSMLGPLELLAIIDGRFSKE